MLLFYLDAALSVVFGGLRSPVVALLVAAGVAAGLGMANERRWGYLLALGVTGLRVAVLLWVLASEGIGMVLDPDFLLIALVPVAMFVAVIHPQSREHQRIWFR